VQRIVNLERFAISRRSFLIAAAPFAFGLRAIAHGQIPIERGRFSEDDIPLVRDQLVKLVNAERADAGLSSLQLDGLACRVATEHARDIVNGQFLSHWGSDGRKPYHRYSFAGAIDAIRENVSSANNIQSVMPTAVAKDFREMHLSMSGEVPPDDGHRKTILFPQLTHVGFGMAMQGHSLRLDELYIARYVELDPIPLTAKPKATVLLSGKVLNRTYVLTGADSYYEPLPAAPPVEWLRTPRPYGMPDVYERLLPQLPKRSFYPDGSRGTIVLNGARFRARVGLYRKPGINTIMVWLRDGENGIAFPATQICIRCE